MGNKIHRYHVEKDAIDGDKHIINKSVTADDKLKDGSITGDTLLADASTSKGKLTANTISFIVPLQLIKDQTGLDAASTGVKYTSGKFKLDTNGLKSAIIRATWTASDTDSVTDIELYDETAAAVVGSVSGNAGTDAESADLSGGITSGNLHSLRVDVTTASATTTATTDVDYGILELTYGYS